MNEKRELRIVQNTIEVREDGDTRKIVGYAARFNELSEEMWGFKEKIAPGAFKNALLNSDTRALFNHDPNYVLGRKSAGTLTLREDENGLWYEITPPDTQWARDLINSINRGDVKESSFGFTIQKEEWDDSGDIPIRTIVEVKRLYDISPVTFPAYPTTSTGLRGLEYASAQEIFESFRKAKEQRAKSELEILKRKLEILEHEI